MHTQLQDLEELRVDDQLIAVIDYKIESIIRLETFDRHLIL